MFKALCCSLAKQWREDFGPSLGGKVNRNESLKAALAREVREETGLITAAASYRQFYDRPKRGAITILCSVIVKRSSVGLPYPTRETANLGSSTDFQLLLPPLQDSFGNRNSAKSGNSLLLISSEETESAVQI